MKATHPANRHAAAAAATAAAALGVRLPLPLAQLLQRDAVPRTPKKKAEKK